MTLVRRIETTICEHDRFHSLYKEIELFKMRMGIFLFPTNFVYWENIQIHDDIKPSLMEKVELEDSLYKNVESMGIVNASTSFQKNTNLNFHRFMDKNITEQLIWNPLENLLSNLNSTSNSPKIELSHSVIHASWYTKYDENGSFTFHNHYGEDVCVNGKMYKPTFSMIYILNDKNEYNSTQFRIPYGAPLSTFHTNEFNYNTRYNKEIKEGTLLVFPASLYHEVLHVKIPGRVTLAFNIVSRFRDPTYP
jgi:hypothetical protein